MKTTCLLLTLLGELFGGAAYAQAGLTGEYYNGTNFETKVQTRVDPQISFNWRGRSPVPGIGQSYFSVRWTGKLLAPVSGRYSFSAKVDDGLRVWVGTTKIIDAWALHDDDSFRGSIVLEAGKYYDLRVDYFNDLLEGMITLFWHRPDDPTPVAPLKDKYGRFMTGPESYQPIDARYLYRAVPPPPKPVIVPPKPTPKPPVVVPIRKPVPMPAAPPGKPGSSTPVLVVPSAGTAAPTKKPEAETLGVGEAGKTLVLETVFFEQSTYVLLPASFAELDKLVRTLRQNPTVRIELAGHTDNVGDPRLNQSLSDYRARVVKSYLTRQGIADDRIEAVGYGGSRPVAGNDTEAGRAKNRRVTFAIK